MFKLKKNIVILLWVFTSIFEDYHRYFDRTARDLANKIRKKNVILMFKLKNINDNHLYSDIAMGIYFNFWRLSPILWSDCSWKFHFFFFFFTLNLLTFYSGHLIAEKLALIMFIYRWYIILSIGYNHVRYCYCVYRLGSSVNKHIGDIWQLKIYSGLVFLPYLS